MVAAAIRTIFAQPDQAHVHEQLQVIAGMLGRQFPKLEVMLHEAAEEVLAFTAFPVSHWKKIWSTNPLSVNRPERALEAGRPEDPTPDGIEGGDYGRQRGRDDGRGRQQRRDVAA
jgi:transposase-like protein